MYFNLLSADVGGNMGLFLAAEKWTVRSTGVGGLISPQNGKPATLKPIKSFS